MNTNISQIQALLEASILLNGGEEKALEACDRMYSQTFRSEPYTIDELKKENPNYDIDSLKSDLLRSISINCYIAATNNKPPSKVSNEDYDDEREDHAYLSMIESDHDDYYIELEAFEESAIEWFKKTFPTIEPICNSTQIVDFCNYKGEGEGEPELYELNKNLPVFISKKHYYILLGNTNILIS